MEKRADDRVVTDLVSAATQTIQKKILRAGIPGRVQTDGIFSPDLPPTSDTGALFKGFGRTIMDWIFYSVGGSGFVIWSLNGTMIG